MPAVSDTVLDDDGSPVQGATVVIDVLISDPSPGQPGVRELAWLGTTDATGSWAAKLPPQSQWGVTSHYAASVRHYTCRIDIVDEFTVAEDVTIQRLVDRLTKPRTRPTPRAQPIPFPAPSPDGNSPLRPRRR